MERTTTPLIFLKGANLVIHEERVNFIRQPTLMPRRMQIKLAILQKNKGSRAKSEFPLPYLIFGYLPREESGAELCCLLGPSKPQHGRPHRLQLPHLRIAITAGAIIVRLARFVVRRHSDFHRRHLQHQSALNAFFTGAPFLWPSFRCCKTILINPQCSKGGSKYHPFCPMRNSSL